MKSKAELFIQAAWENNINGLSNFLAEGVDVNIQDEHGIAALIVAAACGHTDATTLLLKYNADKNIRDKEGSTPLMVAAAANRIAVLNLLIATNANIDAKNKHGHTPLMKAVFYRHTEIIKALLKAGASIDVQDESASTALMWAAEEGYSDGVKLLLKAGANKNLEDIYHQTALQYAKTGDHTEVEFLLENFGTFQYRLNEIEFDTDKLVLADKEVYESLCDPISLEIMNDPIAVSSGITYDRKSLEDYFKSKRDPQTRKIPSIISCPISNQTIHRTELNNKTHIITKNLISSFVSNQEAKFEETFSENVINESQVNRIGIFAQANQQPAPVSTAPLQEDSANSSLTNLGAANKK